MIYSVLNIRSIKFVTIQSGNVHSFKASIYRVKLVSTTSQSITVCFAKLRMITNSVKFTRKCYFVVSLIECQCEVTIAGQERRDCYPWPGVTQELCEARNCVWCDDDPSYPSCYYDDTVCLPFTSHFESKR